MKNFKGCRMDTLLFQNERPHTYLLLEEISELICVIGTGKDAIGQPPESEEEVCPLLGSCQTCKKDFRQVTQKPVLKQSERSCRGSKARTLPPAGLALSTEHRVGSTSAHGPRPFSLQGSSFPAGYLGQQTRFQVGVAFLGAFVHTSGHLVWQVL